MKNRNRREILEDFQQKIQYYFKDIQILNIALTHSSYANEMKSKKIAHNERLEFLGDSVLNIIISDCIFHKLSDLPEGDLTKVRANVVCEASLAARGKEINLGQYMMLGKGEDNTGGRLRNSILADAFEAIIGALYLDGGFEVAKKFVLNQLSEHVQLAAKGLLFKDYKTHLQEILQSKTLKKISYKVVKESGPDHDKTFDVEVYLDDKLLGCGQGKSKKEAEQNAAQEAIIKEAYKNA